MMTPDLAEFIHTWSSIDKRISIVITVEQNLLTLYRIYLPPDMRRRGYGTKFMEELTMLADRNTLQITLTPTTMFGTSMETLLSFYSKHGFKIKGSQMFREPELPSFP